MSVSQTSANRFSTPSLLRLGFRPFFLGAGTVAVVFMGIWMGVYGYGWSVSFPNMSPIHWHAHEMLFGYTLAVIAGFLLTAAVNWTGHDTANGFPLFVMFVFWLAARVSSIGIAPYAATVMMIADLAFWLLLTVAVMRPIIKVRQWRQSGIMAKLVLLGLANFSFYAGVFGWVEEGIRWGLYGGLYLIIGLVLTMGRRVIPFFTERGVGHEVQLKNRAWLDWTAAPLFLLFFVFELLSPGSVFSANLALALFFLHSIRLQGWFTDGIRKKPLLWSLYLAYAFIVSGFALLAGGYYVSWNPFLAVHAFAVGGIGVLTLSMMSRVALGHTGRNVHQAPRVLTLAFASINAGSFFRVFVPLFMPAEYALWIGASQAFWIIAFSLFVVTFYPILTRPRIDGRYG